jgi:hypothetical protein
VTTDESAPPQGRVVARAVWTTADQAVSSLSNAALTIVLATTVSAAEFGTFALAFSIYSFLIGVSQALGAQVVVIRFSGRPPVSGTRPSPWRPAPACWSAPRGLLLLGATAMFDLPLPQILLVLAVLLPGAAAPGHLADRPDRPRQARAGVLNDLAWTALQLVGVPMLLITGVVDATPYVAVWGVSALVGGAPGHPPGRPAPDDVRDPDVAARTPGDLEVPAGPVGRRARAPPRWPSSPCGHRDRRGCWGAARSPHPARSRSTSSGWRPPPSPSRRWCDADSTGGSPCRPRSS